jgi:hypothetical protein
VSLEMHLEAVIKQVCRCTWKQSSSEYVDAIRSCDRATLEKHLEAVIEGV